MKGEGYTLPMLFELWFQAATVLPGIAREKLTSQEFQSKIA